MDVMVLILDRNSEHVAHAWRKTGLFCKKFHTSKSEGQKSLFALNVILKMPIHAYSISVFELNNDPDPQIYKYAW